MGLILLTSLLPQLNHPLIITILISFSVLLMTITFLLMVNSSWLSYILFLVFLGGILVLFLYITTLTPNVPMTSPLLPSSLIFIILLPLIVLMPTTLPNNEISFNKMIKMIYSNPFIPMTLFITSFLFLSLLVVTKLAKIQQGPLTPSMYDKTNSIWPSFN
uniref:NADH dehydrogenase subunit 6 n=1 Tax=Litostrophus scaber TaxID=2259356 RepID=UPI00286C272F|nr:NADH dehydrogenase subunit 6 [Litostrophus scaber]WKF19545.1 NADH dehydrogenase subunit 6 [Litostrophus scaber]